MRCLYLVACIPLLIACSGPKYTSGTVPSSQLATDGKLWSSLFHQKAAEYKALCIQAYNIARLRVDDALKQSSSRPRAIITDIDETFLDNSPFAVHQALQEKDYEANAWNEWTAKGTADTLSGALSFFKYAAGHNIEVFYISNRRVKCTTLVKFICIGSALRAQTVSIFMLTFTNEKKKVLHNSKR